MIEAGNRIMTQRTEAAGKRIPVVLVLPGGLILKMDFDPQRTGIRGARDNNLWGVAQIDLGMKRPDWGC